ncbi:MAG TPA: DsrE family protein [Longimicrobiales bacterium]|nr:DsrE family protein [Longimicrobiales bacterium]
MLRTTRILAALLAVSAGTVDAQPVPRQNGPVIRGAGEVFVIADPDIATPVDYTYRAVFEVAQTSEEPGQVNVSFNSAARFLNMHAQAGVPREQLHIALVVHGPAGRDLLNDALYREQYGVANPNIPVLDELARAGVQIILCGQTAAARDLPRAALAEPVQVALSAMTAMVLLQDEGYRLIPF